MATTPAPSFLDATTWSALGEGRYQGTVHTSWYQGRGAFGGVLAGAVLRSMMRELNDAARSPRSFTVHFSAPVTEGEVLLTVRTERAGRQVTHLTARLEQQGQVACVASATFAVSRQTSLVYQQVKVPEAPPAADVPSVPEDAPLPAFGRHFEFRWFAGVPFSGAAEARMGGWIRPRVPTSLDAPLAVALLDAFPPSPSARVEGFCNLATMDLTVHFYAPLPPQGASPEAFWLRTAHSRQASEGYADDLAELWDAEGRLLAQCRQMVAVFPG
jgi:acyl-CoA thioesterase